MALNRTFFALMDERTSKDKSLVLCHVEKGDDDGTKTSVDWLRCWPKIDSLYLSGLAIVCMSWDELKHT